jgi:hypothetical protein
MCLKITYLRFAMAACGDANGQRSRGRADLESAVAHDIGRVDLVKVDHHGARYSSNATYVSTLAPAAAVISVGLNRRYGHPNPAVVRRWDAVGDVFQTGTADGREFDGDVIATTDGTSSFQIRTTNSGVDRTYPLAAAPGHRDSDSGGWKMWIAITALALALLAGTVGLLMWRRARRAEEMLARRAHEERVSASRATLARVFLFIDGLRSRTDSSWLAISSEELASRWGSAQEALLTVALDGPRRVRTEARSLLDQLGRTAREPTLTTDAISEVEQRVWKLVDEL